MLLLIQKHIKIRFAERLPTQSMHQSENTKIKLITIIKAPFQIGNPASILHKSIEGRYRPVRYPDGPITARYRFLQNAYWEVAVDFYFVILTKTWICRLRECSTKTKLLYWQFWCITVLSLLRTLAYNILVRLSKKNVLECSQRWQYIST